MQPIDYCEKALELKADIETRFIVLGEMLMKIRDENMYVGRWESFSDYLEDFHMSESQASRMITVYAYFVKKLNVEPTKLVKAGGPFNLYELYSVAKDKPDALAFVNETLDNMSIWSRTDTQKALREMKTGIVPENCAHEWVEIRFCKKCHSKERIYDYNTLPNA